MTLRPADGDLSRVDPVGFRCNLERTLSFDERLGSRSLRTSPAGQLVVTGIATPKP